MSVKWYSCTLCESGLVGWLLVLELVVADTKVCGTCSTLQSEFTTTNHFRIVFAAAATRSEITQYSTVPLCFSSSRWLRKDHEEEELEEEQWREWGEERTARGGMWG